MPLHDDMGRAVSPARLESVRESAVRHRFEAVERERRPGDITTQTFESASIVVGNRHIGVQTHAALSHTARRDPGAQLHAALLAID
jgi:hypothetical protein